MTGAHEGQGPFRDESVSEALPFDVQAAIADGVDALSPATDAETALRTVRLLALTTTSPEAFAAYHVQRGVAESAEASRSQPRAARAAKKLPRGYTAWSVTAFTLGLVAPALVIAGWASPSSVDAVGMSLAAGITMAGTLALLVALEPGRTSSPLYRGGNFAGGVLVLYAVLWALPPIILLATSQDLASSTSAVVGVVLQIASAIGCAVLSVSAMRHDRERPQWAPRAGTTSPPPGSASVSADRVEERMEQWRRQSYGVLSAEERTRLHAAESQAVLLLAERGLLTEPELADARQRVRDRSDWR